MADYIDRNAAITALRELAKILPSITEAATAAAMAISVISRLPGAWIGVAEDTAVFERGSKCERCPVKPCETRYQGAICKERRAILGLRDQTTKEAEE